MRGIWDGFFPWGSLQAIVKGGVFGWGHAFARHHLNYHVNDRAAEVMASSFGGACQVRHPDGALCCSLLRLLVMFACLASLFLSLHDCFYVLFRALFCHRCCC
jgi:hypothetical protein